MAILDQDRCLACDYSLAGLPRPYRCPECGIDYDDETIVFRPSSIWRYYVPILIGQLYVMYLAANHWAWLVARLGLFGAIMAIALLATYIVVRGYRVARGFVERPFFAALTKDALVIRNSSGPVERLPYSDIAFVSVVDLHPWVQRKQYGEDSEPGLRSERRIPLKGVFAGKREMRAFKRMMTERMTPTTGVEGGPVASAPRLSLVERE